VATDADRLLQSVQEQILAQYWQRVERLVRAASKAGRDLAVSSPTVRQNPETLQWDIVWEHQMLEPGAQPLSGPEKTWHVYRCAGGVAHD
jgi:hypothetical protein